MCHTFKWAPLSPSLSLSQLSLSQLSPRVDKLLFECLIASILISLKLEFLYCPSSLLLPWYITANLYPDLTRVAELQHLATFAPPHPSNSNSPDGKLCWTPSAKCRPRQVKENSRPGWPTPSV